jgi:NADH:ubiquinone oxidoreductase subunit 6 (subunit J)
MVKQNLALAQCCEVNIVVFFIASGLAIASAVAVVAQKNPFVSALALLGNLVSLAVLLLLLSAQFVAAAAEENWANCCC